MKLSNLIVSREFSIKDILSRFEINKYDTVYITDERNRLLGVVTEGDLRRKLISGVAIHETIETHYNKSCVYLDEMYTYEDLLKTFSSEIRSIPILNKKREIIKIIKNTDLICSSPISETVCSKAPARVSFGGGGSDVTHYFVNGHAQVLSLAIQKYARVTLYPTKKSGFHIYSVNFDKEKTIRLNDDIDYQCDFRLFHAIIAVIQPSRNFEMIVDTDFNIGSGLGGSSSVTVAVIGALNMFLDLQLSKKDIAHLAFQCERLVLGVAGGWQDQYASVYGGLVNVTFARDENRIVPINISDEVLDKFNEQFFLLDTNILHDSDEIHKQQRKELSNYSKLELIEKNTELVPKMLSAICQHKFTTLMQLLHESWNLKKQFTDSISSEYLNSIYSYAQDCGVVGGKLLGAGGGGHFLFGAHSKDAIVIRHKLVKKYLNCEPLQPDRRGLRVWSE